MEWAFDACGVAHQRIDLAYPGPVGHLGCSLSLPHASADGPNRSAWLSRTLLCCLRLRCSLVRGASAAFPSFVTAATYGVLVQGRAGTRKAA